MTTIGIIAEYNPFHSGHRYQIEESIKTLSQTGERAAVVVVMSGNWVQQGHCAIADKWTRAKIALEGGADLVLELPTPWATASAQRFARGAIALLEATAVVTHLSFGSEAGDLSSLLALSQGLEDPQFSTLLKVQLKEGTSFPSARQKVLEQLVGHHASLLSTPNNTLGLEYLSALHHHNSTITPMTIPRQGAGFHQQDFPKDAPPQHTSATDLRAKLHAGNWQDTQAFLSPIGEALLRQQDFPSFSHCERAFLAKLMSMTREDWAKLPDSGMGEGLPLRLEQVARTAQSMEEFVSKAKTKRYTQARLRRLVLWAFLGLTQDDCPDLPLYLRVLAMNKTGTQLLHRMKTTATLPICTKPAQIHSFSPPCQRLFEQEVRYTDLYGLCFPQIPPSGREWTQSPVVDLS